MHFAISIPQHAPDGTFDSAALRTYLRRAEELAFSGAWTGEQTLGTLPHLGPVETLSFAAACTEQLRLGCAVFVATQHNPVQLAKSISTLDQLSAGRLEVGLATGGRNRMFSAFATDPNTIVARFNEGLQLMKALWTDERVTFRGRFWQLEDAAMEPKPFQKPGPPVWFGGGHPAMLRRAALHADGFFGAGSTTTAAFAEQVSVLRHELAVSGRDPATMRVAKRVYLVIDDDAERGRARIGRALNDMYGYFGVPDLAPVAVHGTPGMVIDGLRAVADAGAEMILLNPMFDEAEQMERLAAEVVPHIAGADNPAPVAT
jgi:probable F420-dependent oxidoreductase